MANRLIRFNHKINLTLTNTTTPPKFGNSDGTIALIRSDTEAPLSPPDVGDEFTLVSTGQYEYLLEGLTGGLPYTYWVNYTYAGNTTYLERNFTADGVEIPDCYMFTYNDLLTRFGEKNLIEASEKDNDNNEDVNYAAVQQSMLYAVDEVEGALPRYLAPFDVVEPRVKEWAMMICFENMFNARGDTERNTNAYRRLVDDVYKEMAIYNTPIRSLKAAKNPSYNFTPCQG